MNEKAALLMGWRVGQLLRAMRGRTEQPEQPEYEVVFENGILYIKKAPAVMVGSTLSFADSDINGGGING